MQIIDGKQIAQQFCQALLLTYPAGSREFNKKFSSINEFEENRLNALFCERDRNGYEAELFWKKCIEILIREDADNSLKIALVLRHIANLQEHDEETITLLIESLGYDADDVFKDVPDYIMNVYITIHPSRLQKHLVKDTYLSIKQELSKMVVF